MQDIIEFMDDLTKEFLVEAQEHLEHIEGDLVLLEKNPSDPEVIARIFRSVHTIKGASGFLGFKKLQALTHSGESLLSRLRDGKMSVSQGIISTLLELSDTLQKAIKIIEESGKDSALDHTPLVLKMNRILQGTLPEQGKDVKKAETAQTKEKEAEAKPQKNEVAEKSAQTEVLSKKESALPVQEASKTELTAAQVSDATVVQEGQKQEIQEGSQSESVLQHISNGSPAESHVRIDVKLLDKLMNLVGELVLVRNQVLQTISRYEDVLLENASQRLDLVTTELQEEVTRTRLQPIRNAWNRVPRIVRDLSLEAGKEVQLILEGQDTELDRAIIEAIRDPMIHIVRNSIDHGIELPHERKAAGKSPAGTLKLKAYHEGGQVTIEVSDDGRGIDIAKIKKKGIEKGFITAEQANRMTDREFYQLLFLPGFSTAEKVTNVSGRGVGMDVVKTNVEKLGGSVDIESFKGKGTIIKLKIPLTLAIIPALLVKSGNEHYAIPQVNLVELVRVEPSNKQNLVHEVKGSWVYRLRGKLLPLVFLSRVFGLNDNFNEDRVLNIVVLHAGSKQFGLVVDQINDTFEIVVKPLSKHLKRIPVYAGATILGDGTVALILDVIGLAQYAHLADSYHKEGIKIGMNKTGVDGRENGEVKQLLISSIGNQYFAVDLSAIGRLERFSNNQIEYVGNRQVVQYRGGILDLVSVSSALGYNHNGSSDDLINVVVYEYKNRPIGLVVGAIHDIVHQKVSLDKSVARPGCFGRCIVQGKVTELIDPKAIIEVGGINN